MRIFYLFSLVGVILYASTCQNAFNDVDKNVKKYLRINYHMEAYHSTCNIVYAYSIFLHNPTAMNELENDNTYAEHLGEFVKKYPHFANFILNKKSFEEMNKYSSPDKRAMDDAIRKTFSQKDLKNKKNLIYLTTALDIVGEHFDSSKLAKTIQHLQKKYTIEEMEIVILFWNIYSQQYRKNGYDSSKLFNSFEKAVDIYGLATLEEYSEYAVDFYPTLIPKVEYNVEYMKTIKSLLRQIKHISVERQAYFLKNISLDIQIALENGNSRQKILDYFRPFIKRNLVTAFDNLSCFEKQGLAMLVSDHLDYKLDWNRENKEIFPDIMRLLNKQDSQEKMINVLGLYNYASTVYIKMKTAQQKEMFENIVNLPTDNLLFNLSLIYTLDRETTYFSMIINNPSSMYERNKYKEIFYVNRNGKMILNLFRNKDAKFISEINRLATMPFENIHDLTTGEKIDIAIEVVDYASYATMIIPGAGIMVNIGKTLAKTSVKQVIKYGAKKSAKGALKLMKTQAKNYWSDAIKYTGSKTKDKIINQNVLRTDQLLTGTVLTGVAYHYFFSEKQKKLCTEGIK